MPFVYMLECRDGSFYVGSTWDLERRVSEHDLGLGAEYTRRRRPVTLVWHAYSDSISEAYAMEKRVQGWSRAKRRALIDGRLSVLPDLSSRVSSAVARVRASSRSGFEASPRGSAPQPPGGSDLNQRAARHLNQRGQVRPAWRRRQVPLATTPVRARWWRAW